MDLSVTESILSAIRVACGRQAAGGSEEAYTGFHLPDSDWEVWDYFPSMCRHLRQLHGIEDAEYIDSWTLPWEMIQPTTGAGRSGSLFLKSRDGRFLLKSVPENEFSTLQEIFPGYYNHLVQYENSLLTPIFGALVLNSLEGFDSYYVICSLNVVDFGPLSTLQSFSNISVYDLKGREPKPGHFMQVSDHEQHGVLKDKNLDRSFYLPADISPIFHQQLELDVQLLNSLNLMDYSLLVGVATRLPGTPNPLHATEAWKSSRSVFRCFCGGLPVDSEATEVYFLGIIDFLTVYDRRKMLANMLKSIRWESSQLSTIPSEDYAARFLAYFKNCLLQSQSSLGLGEWQQQQQQQQQQQYTAQFEQSPSQEWASSYEDPHPQQQPLEGTTPSQGDGLESWGNYDPYTHYEAPAPTASQPSQWTGPLSEQYQPYEQYMPQSDEAPDSPVEMEDLLSRVRRLLYKGEGSPTEGEGVFRQLARMLRKPQEPTSGFYY
eukprot:RCo026723